MPDGEMWCLVDRTTGEIESVGVLSSFYTSDAHVIGFEKEQDLLDAVDPIWDTHEARKIKFEY